MAGEKKLKREPFAYISKRDGVSLTYRITVRAAAIVLALVVCGIVTKVLTGDNPISIYQTIVHGAVGKGRLLVTIHDIAILLCISLAVTPMDCIAIHVERMQGNHFPAGVWGKAPIVLSCV